MKPAMTDADIEQHAHTVANVVLEDLMASTLEGWFKRWHQGTADEGVRIWARAAVLIRDAVVVST